MDLSRRRVLKYGSLCGVVGLAGCQFEQGSIPDPSSQGNDAGSETVRREFGETVVFENDDGERLDVRPVEARVTDAFFEADSSDLGSTQPNEADRVFLDVRLAVENPTTNTVELPDDIALRIDGQQYSLNEDIPQNEFEPFREIPSESTYRSRLPYAIPADATAAELVLSSLAFDTIAVWTIDLESIEQDRISHTDLATGEAVTVGTDSRQFSFAVTGVDTLQQYQYERNGTTETARPADGNQFVRATVRAENTGSQRVQVPRPNAFRLVAGTTQQDTTEYRRETDAYTGGILSSGVTTEGALLFEAPASAAPERLEVTLVDDFVGTWTL